jgi:hypothetical protein
LYEGEQRQLIEREYDLYDAQTKDPSKSYRAEHAALSLTTNMMFAPAWASADLSRLMASRFWDGVRWNRVDPETLEVYPEEQVVAACRLVQDGVQFVQKSKAEAKCLPAVQVPRFSQETPEFKREGFWPPTMAEVAIGAAALVAVFSAVKASQ